MDESEEKLLNLRPIVLSAVFLAVGILCAYLSFLYSYFISVVFLSLLCVAVLLASVIKSKNKKKLQIFLCLALIFFVLGQGFTYARINKAKNLTYHENYSQFSGTVYDISFNDYGATIYLKDCTFASYKLNSKAVGFVFNNQIVPKMDIGAVMTFDCRIINRVKAEDYSYKVFSGVYYSLEEITDIQITDFGGDFFELGYLNARQFLKKNLSKESYPMALALLLGETNYYNETALQNYRFAGIAHVFAVSGLHIGVVVSLFTFLAKRIKLKRKITPFFILIPTLIYCGICGFRPSSLRAFFMATLTILANYIGFKKDNLSFVSLSAIVLLLLNPFNLFDYGFRLSYVAVISIFALVPVFQRYAKPIKGLSDALSVSLSAQIGTLPILCRMSGYMSIISVFINVLFVPVAVCLYIIIFASFSLSAVLSLFFKNAGVVMVVGDYLISAVDFLISKMQFSTFAIPVGFGVLEVIWYLGFACVCDYINLSGKRKLLIGCLTVIITFVTAILISA